MTTTKNSLNIPPSEHFYNPFIRDFYDINNMTLIPFFLLMTQKINSVKIINKCCHCFKYLFITCRSKKIVYVVDRPCINPNLFPSMQVILPSRLSIKLTHNFTARFITLFPFPSRLVIICASLILTCFHI